MTGEQYKAVTDFEDSLTIGTPVMVRWTNIGFHLKGDGKVAKINAKSIIVELEQDVKACEYTWKAGQTIKVPNIDNIKQWTHSNRVEPVGGYPPV